MFRRATHRSAGHKSETQTTGRTVRVRMTAVILLARRAPLRAPDDPARPSGNMDDGRHRPRLPPCGSAGGIHFATVAEIAALAMAAELVELSVTARFARRYGGSRRAAWGAVIGGFIGMIVGVPVPIIGPVIAGLLGTFLGH